VLGTTGCDKAKNIRKHLISIPYHKQLISNPLAELGIISSNKSTNHKCKLAEAEGFDAMMKKLEEAEAKLTAQSYARGDGSVMPWQSASTRGFIVPKCHSCKLSAAEKSVRIQKSFPQTPHTPLVTSSDSSYSSLSSMNVNQSTMTYTHGPSSAKKVRYADLSELPESYSPAPQRAKWRGTQQERAEQAVASQLPISSPYYSEASYRPRSQLAVSPQGLPVEVPRQSKMQ
jgi:hypothetical protein